MLFKTWNKILEEHEEIERQIIEVNDLLSLVVETYNVYISPIEGQIRPLREKLPTSTTRERIELEKQIDELVDDKKHFDAVYSQFKKEHKEKEEKLCEYMKKTLTEEELKKARKHGWEV